MYDVRGWLLNPLTVSENPQTFQHALLVLSKLAKISPDSIIHAIMPIFTFMGVNLFPRDDSYTFNVVLQVSALHDSAWSDFTYAWKQTINNIVPLMVDHLRSGPKTTLEIQIGETGFTFYRETSHYFNS